MMIISSKVETNVLVSSLLAEFKVSHSIVCLWAWNVPVSQLLEVGYIYLLKFPTT